MTESRNKEKGLIGALQVSANGRDPDDTKGGIADVLEYDVKANEAIMRQNLMNKRLVLESEEKEEKLESSPELISYIDDKMKTEGRDLEI